MELVLEPSANPANKGFHQILVFVKGEAGGASSVQPRAKQSGQKHSDDMLLRLRLHDTGTIKAST